MFEREDWMLFRNLNTLAQKAGVPQTQLAKLCAKEVVDNASEYRSRLGEVTAEIVPNGFCVRDYGPGISADPAFIARLFSIKRPLLSSKLIRLPTRGALGNGLRVVVGTVLASNGTLTVETFGCRFELSPQDSGETLVNTYESEITVGTRITVTFGEALANQRNILEWAEQAIAFANVGKQYKGKTSAWWYDQDSFYEMLASNTLSLQSLLARFAHMSPADVKALAGQFAEHLDRDDAGVLLRCLREYGPAPKPSALGKMGDYLPGYGYANVTAEIEVRNRGLAGVVPCSIDVFAECSDENNEDDQILFMVNRTPITGDIRLIRQKSHELGIIGCGLSHILEVGRKKVCLVINITTPYMPISTDGKQPDLARYLGPLTTAVKKACRKGRALAPKDESKATQRQVIDDHLGEAIAKASGDGAYRYSLRQLFYALRPYLLEKLGKEPEYTYFGSVITAIEAELGRDLPGMYRDNRGMIYHPHIGEEIPLGTINVERYRRPEYTIRSVLYVEKQGLMQILREAGWPERNDCALVSSQGFASRAARDVLDLMGESDEPINFYSLHDADAAGGMIHQTLIQETRARKGRKVNFVNLGLDPWDALEMGLQRETFREDTGRNMRRLAVADYVAEKDNGYWADWLQTQRVELNAMTSPQFIAWLDSKFEDVSRKLVPNEDVMRKAFATQGEEAIRLALTQKILREAGLEQQVAEAMIQLQTATKDVILQDVVETGLLENPQLRWDKPLDILATQTTQKLIQGS